MSTKKTAQIALAAMFLALAVIVPSLMHGIPNAGTLFLPMHFPVLLGAFFLEPCFALAVGLLSPVMNTLINGMPPAFPVLPFMTAELAVYALAASILFRKLKLDKSISLVLAMVAGRLAAALAVYVLVQGFGAKLPSAWKFFAMAFTGSLPGIAIQLAAIPALITVLQRSRR